MPFLLAGVLAMAGYSFESRVTEPAFRVLVVASSDSDHDAMIVEVRPFLQEIAIENGFALDFTRDANEINEANLAQYQVFVQFHLAPFNMSLAQQAALDQFIEAGHGWIGIGHDVTACRNPHFRVLMRDAMLWAADPPY